MGKFNGFLLIFVLSVCAAGAAYVFRYEYFFVQDARLRSGIMSSVTLMQEIKRPLRIDRWTGRIQIYSEKGIWKDFSEWNDKKYESFQTSVRQLTAV